MANKKMAIIATKGALDMAYPPLILASTAAALDWEVQIFFTFYGLQLLRKDLSGVAISPIGNPAMPMPVPMPVLVSALPGMQAMASSMMKAKMKKRGHSPRRATRGARRAFPATGVRHPSRGDSSRSQDRTRQKSNPLR